MIKISSYQLYLSALVVCALLSGQGAYAATSTLIKGALLFDARGTAPFQADVLITGDRIAEIGERIEAPIDVEIIDAEGLALLPGFFDLHVHFTPRGKPATAPQILQAYSAAGVTTVFNFHSPPEAFAPQRVWFSNLDGPRVSFVARMSTPGGHGAEWGDKTTTRLANSPAAARASVDHLATYQPDAIKAFADGWRYGSGVDTTSMDEPTLSALVATAHKHKIPVLTHTVTAARAALAGRAEVDVLAHSTLDRHLTAEEIQNIKVGKTAYAGTLAVYDPDKPRTSMNEAREKRLRAMFAIGLRNMKALHDAGVPIVLGTDAGMPGTPHGPSTHREMELMVTAGLTPEETLMAATSISADAARVLADRGTIEEGKLADLVLIKGRPWLNIADVRNVVTTLVAGAVIFDIDAAVPETPRHPTSLQIMNALIDDFDGPAGRTSRDTLRVSDYDMGKARSRQVVQTRWESSSRGRVLNLSGELAYRENPYVGVTLPFFRGSVTSADVSHWAGVKADLRGVPGEIEIAVTTRSGIWTRIVDVTTEWQTFDVPWTQFSSASSQTWQGTDAIDVRFRVLRAGGESVWLDIDSVQLF